MHFLFVSLLFLYGLHRTRKKTTWHVELFRRNKMKKDSNAHTIFLMRYKKKRHRRTLFEEQCFSFFLSVLLIKKFLFFGSNVFLFISSLHRLLNHSTLQRLWCTAVDLWKIFYSIQLFDMMIYIGVNGAWWANQRYLIIQTRDRYSSLPYRTHT
jgi:hypothetical protein